MRGKTSICDPLPPSLHQSSLTSVCSGAAKAEIHRAVNLLLTLACPKNVVHSLSPTSLDYSGEATAPRRSWPSRPRGARGPGSRGCRARTGSVLLQEAAQPGADAATACACLEASRYVASAPGTHPY